MNYLTGTLITGAFFVSVAILGTVIHSAYEYFTTKKKVDWIDLFHDKEGQSDEVKKANAEMRRKISKQNT